MQDGALLLTGSLQHGPAGVVGQSDRIAGLENGHGHGGLNGRGLRAVFIVETQSRRRGDSQTAGQTGILVGVALVIEEAAALAVVRDVQIAHVALQRVEIQLVAEHIRRDAARHKHREQHEGGDTLSETRLFLRLQLRNIIRHGKPPSRHHTRVLSCTGRPAGRSARRPCGRRSVRSAPRPPAGTSLPRHRRRCPP